MTTEKLCANANEGHNNNDRGSHGLHLSLAQLLLTRVGIPPSLTTLLCVEVVVAPSAKG